MTSRTIKLTLEYDGTGYSGFQKQKRGKTIQGELEKALRILCGEEIAVFGAGRTDVGVHALGQVCHFRIGGKIQFVRLLKGLNSLLRPGIVAREADFVPDDFHARYSAVSKVYAYFILNRPSPSALFHPYLHWVPYALDEKSMAGACRFLIGRKNFLSFQKNGSSQKNSWIDVKRADCFRGTGDLNLPFGCLGNDVIVFCIEARNFLYRMVRGLAGTLIEIGKGKIPPAEMEKILESKNRKAAGPTAPAKGLFLVRVKYEEDR